MAASVSTIIPCYRCSQTIDRAIDSVAKQTLLPAEVIIVDDGSDDSTLELLLQFQRDYGKDWIKVIALEDNRGVSIARNTAWNMASHDYIAFLDADEAWHPEKIAVQYSWMLHHPEVVLSGHDSVRIEAGYQFNHKAIPRDIKFSLVSKNQLLISNVFSTSCVMLKRNIKQRFSPYIKSSEDYLLWLEIILKGEKAAVINFSGTYYFKNLFGESGLTKNIFYLQENEVRIYRELWKSSSINLVEWYVLFLWSLAKHYRRICICLLRQVKEGISHA
jgi:glycosyltransferase involved in cell wall biosynthesis